MKHRNKTSLKVPVILVTLSLPDVISFYYCISSVVLISLAGVQENIRGSSVFSNAYETSEQNVFESPCNFGYVVTSWCHKALIRSNVLWYKNLIVTDCTSSCKSNYHTITTTTATSYMLILKLQMTYISSVNISVRSPGRVKLNNMVAATIHLSMQHSVRAKQICQESR
jgi:hypothetical protein